MTHSAIAGVDPIDAWLTRWPGETSARARATEERITRTAQQMTVERGLDGFTMSELALATGVSRRTLFNHFSSKVDAVLGNPPAITRAQVDAFCSLPGKRNLVRDIGTLVAESIADDANHAEDARRLPVLMADPRIMSTAVERFAEAAEKIAGLAALHGHELSHRQSRLAVLLLAGVAHEALESIVADDSLSFASLFLELLEETLALAG